MAAPTVLIASCSSEFNPAEIVQSILDKHELPTAVSILKDIVAYPWHIDTKYYIADVNICTTDSRTLGNSQFAESVEAFIFQFDTKKESSFEQLKSWLPFLKELSPEVQILLCERCKEGDAVSKELVWDWCLDHSFELVELDPELEATEEDEDDFADAVGIKRVVQALHAHTWQNLVMKENPSIQSPYFQQMMQDKATDMNAKKDTNSSSENKTEQKEKEKKEDSSEASSPKSPVTTESVLNAYASLGQSKCESDAGTRESCGACGTAADTTSSSSTSEDLTSGDKKKKAKNNSNRSSNEIIDSILPECEGNQQLLEALSNEEPGTESFEKLFQQFRVMKDKAEGLPPEQRKAYAEKVAVSFWRAIGGDDDEVDGVSDDSGEG